MRTTRVLQHTSGTVYNQFYSPQAAAVLWKQVLGLSWKSFWVESLRTTSTAANFLQNIFTLFRMGKRSLWVKVFFCTKRELPVVSHNQFYIILKVFSQSFKLSVFINCVTCYFIYKFSEARMPLQRGGSSMLSKADGIFQKNQSQHDQILFPYNIPSTLKDVKKQTIILVYLRQNIYFRLQQVHESSRGPFIFKGGQRNPIVKGRGSMSVLSEHSPSINFVSLRRALRRTTRH